MTYTFSVDISNRSHKLVRIQFYNQIWNHLFHFEILFHHSISSIGNIIHYYIQIDFIRLISVCIEALSHFNTIWMMQHFQYCKFSIFISFVLEYFFYCYRFSSLSYCCFKYHSEWSISNYFLRIISHTLC